MQLLPPRPDKCQFCAVSHSPTDPHNAQSLYYQTWFQLTAGRRPTWADAMEHCPQSVKQAWMNHFEKLSLDIHSTNLTGDLKSQDEVSDRLK